MHGFGRITDKTTAIVAIIASILLTVCGAHLIAQTRHRIEHAGHVLFFVGYFGVIGLLTTQAVYFLIKGRGFEYLTLLARLFKSRSPSDKEADADESRSSDVDAD